MALVIFFVPEPSKELAEMERVVRPGLVAAYAWDVLSIKSKSSPPRRARSHLTGGRRALVVRGEEWLAMVWACSSRPLFFR